MSKMAGLTTQEDHEWLERQLIKVLGVISNVSDANNLRVSLRFRPDLGVEAVGQAVRRTQTTRTYLVIKNESGEEALKPIGESHANDYGAGNSPSVIMQDLFKSNNHWASYQAVKNQFSCGNNAKGFVRVAPVTFGDSRRGARTGCELSGDVHDLLKSRREFLSYWLLLMRGHNGEHADTLPVTDDVSFLKHIVYVFYALIYYMRSVNESKPCEDNANDDDFMLDMYNELGKKGNNDLEGASKTSTETESATGVVKTFSRNGRKRSFFHRSYSTLCLRACHTQPDLFAVYTTAIFLLADQFYLLQKGAPHQPIKDHHSETHPKSTLNPLKVIPIRLDLTTEIFEIRIGLMKNQLPTATSSALNQPKMVKELSQNQPQDLNIKDIKIPRQHTTAAAGQRVVVPADTAGQGSSSSTTNHSASQFETDSAVQPFASYYWLGKSATFTAIQLTSTDLHGVGHCGFTLDCFSCGLIDVGIESCSFIADLRGFPIKEARFCYYVERLRNIEQCDLTFFYGVRRGVKEFNTQCNTHFHQVTPALTVSRVQVTFKDKLGMGCGVKSWFYTAIAKLILIQEKTVNLDAAQVRAGFKTTQSQSSMTRCCNLNSITGDQLHRRGLFRLASIMDSRSRMVTYFARPLQWNGEEIKISNDHPSRKVIQLGDILYSTVSAFLLTIENKNAGMFMVLFSAQFRMLYNSEGSLEQLVNKAVIIVISDSSLGSDGLFVSSTFFQLFIPHTACKESMISAIESSSFLTISTVGCYGKLCPCPQHPERSVAFTIHDSLFTIHIFESKEK